MAQTFLDYEEQINKLTKEKELTINNQEYAIGMLKQLSYFSLIGGYKEIFVNPSVKKYYYDVKFEDIVCLYRFDENLRILFMRYILKIERKLHSVLSYHFTKKYGEEQKHYLNAKNYNYNTKNKNGIDKLIRTLKTTIKESKYKYIKYHREHYSNVPLWMLAHTLSFGTVSKMYQYSKHSLRARICIDFEYVNERQLDQILSVMTKFRNVCAHGERLFSYKTVDSIGDLLIHEKLKIKKKNSEYIYGKKDLFSVVISLRYILNQQDFLSFKKQLKKLIADLINDVDRLELNDILKKMGFPENWEEISRFRKLK